MSDMSGDDSPLRLEDPADKLILIVDKDESILDLMEHIVRKEGFKVERADRRGPKDQTEEPPHGDAKRLPAASQRSAVYDACDVGGPGPEDAVDRPAKRRRPERLFNIFLDVRLPLDRIELFAVYAPADDQEDRDTSGILGLEFPNNFGAGKSWWRGSVVN